METPKQPKRRAQRQEQKPIGRKVVHGETSTIGLEREAWLQLEQHCKKLKISKTVFASEAVKFFTSQGLDPTQPRATTLPEIGQQLAMLTTKVGEMQETARKQSADIANRVVGMWRTLEKNLYQHLSTEQLAMLSYLESIEANLLDRATATESQYLWPLMERMLRVVRELGVTRQIASDIYEIQGDPTIPDSKQLEVNLALEREIQAAVVGLSRQLLESVKLTELKKTRRPDLTVIPTSALPPPKVAVPAMKPPAQP